ncbi:MAG TPA: YihY/virulence factor BrkB family protein [Candidatus Binatia bacterium]|nr:YihY/virulence factor BrkB family protein [Candidatus Binatia bacterium]
MQKKPAWQFLKDVVYQWIEDSPFQLAAAVSYYALFSMAPLLVISISVAGFFFGREAAQNQVVDTIRGTVGQESAQAIQAMIQDASEKPKTGIVSTIIGGLALLFGAGGVVGQLQTALNTIWGVAPKPGLGVWGFVRQRFVSFAMVVGIGFLLLVSLVVSALLAGVTELLNSFFNGAALIAHALDILVSFAFITVLFAVMFKFLPDARIRWRDVWIGAALTSLLFTIGKFLIGLYLGTSGVTSAYGAAGSLITVLLWVYYSSLIFFFGAEFTQVYATQFGSGVVPAENAQSMAAAKAARESPPPEKRSA